MHLKTLEMLGFKSFSDKTTITFQPGVTAVVGPNGCGKSNISDAIRWVLGEQSARHLRGDKMEDVIFNGSDSRKPLGMAEVTLTLKNVEGLSSDFGHYREIEITRRLFRSGESEYLINRIPCRLKDIRDLMMDAGVGAKIHAIIEQDRVDQILSSKPQDRRFLFEEVAGVMKYKARRQEALSKLESTQQNQVRVNDIITEVKRQLNSLDRQAKKAERYQKLRSEMKDLDLRLAAAEYSGLGFEWASSSEEFKGLEAEITGLQASLGRIESYIEETKAESLSAERELSALRNGLHDTENALSRAEHRVEMSKNQISSLTEQRERGIKDMEYLKAETARAAEQASRLKQEAGALASDIYDKKAVLSEKNAASDAMLQSFRDKELSIEEARTGVLNALNESAAEKTRIANLQSNLYRIHEEDERGRKESETLLAHMNELRTLLDMKQREISDISAKRQAMEEERARISERLVQTLAKKESLESELGGAKDVLAARKSRLRSLIELEQSLEGYQKGVQTVMSARNGEASPSERLGNILGLVADIIETEPKYETAIEAVLGDRLQYVVVGSQNDSLKAIEFLKAEGGGRSTFVPESPREIGSEPFVKNGHNGVIGPAMDIVRCKNDSYHSVAQYLLGDVVVVDNIDTAIHLWENNGFHKTLVTLSGEVVDPWGAVTGGAPESGGAGMLRKRREIKDLDSEVSVLSKKVSDIEMNIQSVSGSIDSDKSEEAGLMEQVHRMEIEFLGLENERNTVNEDLRRSDLRLNVLNAEAEERSALRKGVIEDVERSAEALKGFEEGRTSAQTSIESLQAELRLNRESIEHSRTEITEIKMAVAALQEKLTAAESNLSSAASLESDLAGRIEAREAEIKGVAMKLTELEAGIRDAETEIRKLVGDIETQRNNIALKQEAHSEKLRALDGYEDQARLLRHDIDTAQKKLSAVEVKRTELRMKIEHLKDNIWNSYHTEIDAAARDLGRIEIDAGEAGQRLDELRQKIDQMGPINTDALQEYNELKERYDLLSSQQSDINESIENLRKTIAKLDGETKELFISAYNAIHDKFKEVFSLLFEGGRAELVLLDESNMLESGIEIIAQPRGKRLQSISLLSGGERALTAIALLFAAFLVKPSPFCMLDEVDAPLDEANVTRFTRLLREMSSRSQFIVITHNKRTMEMADALYGITMEEPGCSKVVSVQLREPVAV